MSIKIAHIAKYSHNIGEGAMIHGIRETFKSDVSKSVDFVAFDRKDFQAMRGNELSGDSVSTRIDRDFVDFVNNNYHMLMIGGGGVFQTGRYDQLGGMAVAGDMDALSELRRPLIVYGVGDNRFIETNPFLYSNEILNLVDYINENDLKFSFRDDGSCERMSSVVGKSLQEHVDIIPDPGLFLNVPKKNHPLIKEGNKTILFQVAGDRIEERLSFSGERQSEDLVDAFVRNVVSALFHLSKEFDARIVLTPHIPSDYSLITKIIDVASKMRLGHSGFMRERITVNYCSAGFDGAPDFFSIYPLVDLVIGMRFHSAVCAAGLGVPFIAIDTMPKVGRFMSGFGLGDYAVSASDPALDKSLYNVASHLVHDKHEWATIRNSSMQKARQDIFEFNRSCAEMI